MIRRRLILVLGMHRSGTSLVARGMRCLGAGLGKHAEWTAPDNPQGFWEDREVLGIDEYVLRHLGYSWDRVTPNWAPSGEEMLRPARDMAVKVLEQRFSEFPIFALKEPRMCRLLPFWSDVFARVGCEVSVVHVIRHPAPVAASLLKRNHLPLRLGVDLWRAYNEEVLLGLEAMSLAGRVTVEYMAFSHFPLEGIRSIAGSLGFPLVEDEIDEFRRYARAGEEPADEATSTEIRALMLWHQMTTDALPFVPYVPKEAL